MKAVKLNTPIMVDIKSAVLFIITIASFIWAGGAAYGKITHDIEKNKLDSDKKFQAIEYKLSVEKETREEAIDTINVKLDELDPFLLDIVEMKTDLKWIRAYLEPSND